MDDEVRKILKEEYLYLHKVIDDFDSKALTIKTWSITYSLAAIGLALYKNVEEILIIAFLSSLCFWVIESFWKSFQMMNYKRISEIEKACSDDGADHIPIMQIRNSWDNEYKMHGFKTAWKSFRQPFVFLPHAFVCAVALILFVHIHLSKCSIPCSNMIQ